MARPAPVPAPAPAAQPRPAPRKDPFGLDDAPGASAPAPVAPSLADSSGPDLSWEDSSEPAAPSLDVSMDEAEAPAAEPQGIELPEVDGPGPELAPMHTFVPPPESTGHQPEAAADAGERVLREALSKASREVIERVVWEVVPELAETIIRENLDRLVKGRQK